MNPELFTIPLTDITVKSYGLMLALGFLSAVILIRHLTRRIGHDPQLVLDGALYALIGGIIGARLFYVVHYFDQFRGNLLSIFAIWRGGLEMLGGVALALVAVIWYLRKHKLPIRKFFDIIAIAMFAVLAFGRIGCFLNGCCYGKPAPDLAWSVTFPYGSMPFHNQISPDPGRDRSEPYIELSDDFFTTDIRGRTILKPYDQLTETQKASLDSEHKCMAVHPTQLYSSFTAVILGLSLFGLWRLTQHPKQRFLMPGSIFSLMLIFYGTQRFIIEFFRDDNPFEFTGLTISQNISIGMFIIGIAMIVFFNASTVKNAVSKAKSNRRS